MIIMSIDKAYLMRSLMCVVVTSNLSACIKNKSMDKDKMIYGQIDSVKLKYDYELLSKYLVIENYRYKLNIHNEEIEKLNIDTISISKFLNDITQQNENIAKNETDPEHFIRLTLPGKGAVIVPTLLKDGTRSTLSKNADKYPMFKSLSIEIDNTNNSHIY